MSRKSIHALAGSIGGHVTASKYDGEKLTRSARHAFLARFEQDVDPDGLLSPEERNRRALSARRAHFARLAMKSAQARRRKGGA